MENALAPRIAPSARPAPANALAGLYFDPRYSEVASNPTPQFDPTIEGARDYAMDPRGRGHRIVMGFAANPATFDAARGAVQAVRAAQGSPHRLPPVENSRLTQVATTGGTYERAAQALREGGAEGPMIDYGAGRGHGTRYLGPGAESFEPYPNAAFSPTYTNPAAVPSDHYGGLVNLNVLNVLPPEVREQVVREMGRVVRPQGQMVITTRGRDVMDARGVPGPEPMSLIIGEGDRARYQKGFTQPELRNYLQRILGERFAVEPLALGPAGARVRRLYGGAGIGVPGGAALLAESEGEQ